MGYDGKLDVFQPFSKLLEGYRNRHIFALTVSTVALYFAIKFYHWFVLTSKSENVFCVNITSGFMPPELSHSLQNSEIKKFSSVQCSLLL